MDKKLLEKRRSEAESQFNSLQEEKAKLNQRIQQIDSESAVLQGRYYELGDLLDMKSKDKANTIKVEDKDEG